MTTPRPVNFSAHPNPQVRRDVAYLLTLNPILNLVPERVDRDTVARWLGAILRDMNESDKSAFNSIREGK